MAIWHQSRVYCKKNPKKIAKIKNPKIQKSKKNPSFFVFKFYRPVLYTLDGILQYGYSSTQCINTRDVVHVYRHGILQY